jgi:hypothetical protein
MPTIFIGCALALVVVRKIDFIMQTARSLTRPARSAYILIVTLAFLSVALISFASMMYWVNTNSKITKRNILFNQTQAAAESVTETVMAAMIRDFFNQSLNPVATYTSSTNLPSQLNWPMTFQFANTNGNNNTTFVSIGPTNWTTLPSQFIGLQGLGQFCDIISQATPLNVGENLSAKIYQQVWFGAIPIFQFAIFYNMDLEINPGASMNINGRVHSNNDIFATGSSSGSPLIFSDIVEAAQQVNTTPDPLDPNNTARSGNVTFTISTNNPMSGTASLTLPIGTNNNPATVIGMLDIPPAGTVASSPNGQSYPYNQADIIITNGPDGTNLYAFYQNLNNATQQTLIPKDVTNIDVSGTSYFTNPVTHTVTSNPIYTTNTYYSFATNVAFYDYREANTVKAIQLDVGKFGKWLTTNSTAATYQSQNTSGSTSKGHAIDGIYMYNGVPSSSTVLPAVRLINGSQLPSPGLTVATPFPIYVKGDYNTTTDGTHFSKTLGDTTNTYPAGLMGDAITILSANWLDTYTSATSLGSRQKPTAITINAACLEGIVPSDGSHYSGGVENFLRLLEDWGGVNITYNGSIVVLFESQYATSPWPGTGTVYNAPSRTWGFDLNFKQGKLPPMTPQLRAIYRSLWSSK